ncbi:hypothetical protein [Onishia taeanensis]
MNSRSMAAFLVLQLLLAGGSEPLPAATSVQAHGEGSVLSKGRRSGSSSSVEAMVSGGNARIDVNGDHVEIKGGRLMLNGVSYGRVHERSTVIYRVVDGEKTLLVDGRVRRPAKPG